METRTLTDEELRRIVGLMQEYGSIAYAMERARAFVAAAKRDLDLFHDNTAKRALAIAMVVEPAGSAAGLFDDQLLAGRPVTVLKIDAALAQRTETARHFLADAPHHLDADLLFAIRKMEIERAARCVGSRQQFRDADALITALAKEIDRGGDHVFPGG